jgi:hypothetical protein
MVVVSLSSIDEFETESSVSEPIKLARHYLVRDQGEGVLHTRQAEGRSGEYVFDRLYNPGRILMRFCELHQNPEEHCLCSAKRADTVASISGDSTAIELN